MTTIDNDLGVDKSVKEGLCKMKQPLIRASGDPPSFLEAASSHVLARASFSPIQMPSRLQPRLQDKAGCLADLSTPSRASEVNYA